jgi:hypothetical protein
MVDLKSVQSTNKTLVEKPIVVVFTGATSGIGSYAVKALAATHAESRKVFGCTLLDEMKKQPRRSSLSALLSIQRAIFDSSKRTTYRLQRM